MGHPQQGAVRSDEAWSLRQIDDNICEGEVHPPDNVIEEELDIDADDEDKWDVMDTLLRGEIEAQPSFLGHISTVWDMSLISSEVLENVERIFFFLSRDPTALTSIVRC